MPSLAPLRVPEFGRWLKTQRLSKRMSDGQPRSQEFVQIRLRDLMTSFGAKIGKATLSHFEAGALPSWHWLLALSAVYEVSLNETLSVLIRSLQADNASVRDLLCHSDEVESRLAPIGGPQDDSQARLLAAKPRPGRLLTMPRRRQSA